MSSTDLMFGLNYGVPHARARWGARLIVSQDGWVDFVPGRNSDVGEPDALAALFAAMDERIPMRQLADLIAEKLRAGELRTRERRLVTIFDDGDVVVLGNTNASHGYLYLTAYRKCDVLPLVPA